jgi:hypothetical protein
MIAALTLVTMSKQRAISAGLRSVHGVRPGVHDEALGKQAADDKLSSAQVNDPLRRDCVGTLRFDPIA